MALPMPLRLPLQLLLLQPLPMPPQLLLSLPLATAGAGHYCLTKIGFFFIKVNFLKHFDDTKSFLQKQRIAKKSDFCVKGMFFVGIRTVYFCNKTRYL